MKLYVVRFKDGCYARGTSRVDDLLCARLYVNIGPAKGCATRWAKHGDFCDLLEFDLDPINAVVVDMGEYARKQRSKIAEHKAVREKAYAKQSLQWAEQEHQRRTAALEEMRRKAQ